ncbi:MAG: recombinase RecJ [Candidatus Heimdallarchaeota archaeon]|nr:recombinase RecJ [Candidatus Heimdallarchaeota archaeon]
MSTNKKPEMDVENFFTQIKEAIGFFKELEGTILCISHIDADGLTSAGIIGRALHREGIQYHIRSVRQLELPIISELSTMKGVDNIIFTDLGAGQLEGINKYLKERNIIILDHHPPVVEPASENIINVTPFDSDIDGAYQISGAGVAYFFAKELNKKNIDSAPLAVVGALADRQDKGEKSNLVGLNRQIVQDGIKTDLLEERLDIRLFGRETRPIHQSLEYTTDPFIPGLSGNADMCHRFLRDTNIPRKKGEEWRTIQDLTKKERAMLVDALITYGLSHGMSVEETQSILGEVYVLTKEHPKTFLRDAREFGSLLNSCGRLGATGIAIGICMGERQFLYDKAQEILSEYRLKIAKALELVQEESDRLKEYSNIIVFDGREGLIDDTMIGTIISIVISSQPFNEKNKPLLGMAESDDGTTKISARGTGELVAEGLDLGEALREAASSIGSNSEGGGHNIAAGARVPQGTEQLFLEKVNSVIEEQFTRKDKTTMEGDK